MMKCFSIKRAYFIIASMLTMTMLVGGFVLIIMNEDKENVQWARELIGMVITLWVPSPAENLKDMLKERREDYTSKHRMNMESATIQNDCLRRNPTTLNFNEIDVKQV